jgi:hypothetical protein
VRFHTVDVFVDSGALPLAAYQLTFSATSGDAKIVGIEGGGHPAFKEPPYYDPKAIQRELVILAAFNTATADQLPTGKTRIATIHLQVSGSREPRYAVKPTAAAGSDGRKISVECSATERSEK